MVPPVVVMQKKRGRPAAGGADPIVPVRMPMAMRDALDSLIAAGPEPRPSRSEAIRRALAEHLRAQGRWPDDEAVEDARSASATAERYADADPNESVMVTGVGPMILRRAVRKCDDWRHHHGLGLISIYRGADKEPSVFDMGDLDRLAGMDRFK